MIDKTKLLEQLRAGPTKVKFTKVDGEVREMNCTLNEDLLPSQTQKDNAVQSRKENPNVQSVWDLDKQAWRAFRWENVISNG